MAAGAAGMEVDDMGAVPLDEERIVGAMREHPTRPWLAAQTSSAHSVAVVPTVLPRLVAGMQAKTCGNSFP